MNPSRKITVTLGMMGLFAAAWILPVLFPYPGARKWDGLMSATVLARWEETPLSAILYFAHPLVIPLTRLFDLVLPFRDPIFITAIRESLFAAGAAALIYLLARHLWGRLPAVLMALAYLLPFSHWQLATQGEEKDALAFFTLLFLLPYFHLRGDVRFPAFEGLSRVALLILLSVALALVMMVHMQAVLLAPFFVLDTLLRREVSRNPREAFLDLLWVLGLAGLLTLLFYGYVVLHVNGIRTFSGAMDWFLAYHREGFFRTDYAWGEQLVQAYSGFRAYLLGRLPAPLLAFECGLALASAAWIIRSGMQHRPGLAVACLIYLALYAAYFFNYQPWDPEAWAVAAVPGLVLLGLAVFEAEPGLRKAGMMLWILGLILLGVRDIAYYTREAGSSQALRLQIQQSGQSGYGLLESRFQDHIPDALSIRIADRLMPPDAVVAVGNRHLANYFLIYTRREPVVVDYLDQTQTQLVKEYHLSILSMLFYQPRLTSRDLIAMAGQGRPIYHFSARGIERDGRILLQRGLQARPVWMRGRYILYEMVKKP